MDILIKKIPNKNESEIETILQTNTTTKKYNSFTKKKY